MSDTLESLTAWAAAAAPPAAPPAARQQLALDVLKDGRHVEALPLFATKRVCVLGRHSQMADVVLDHASLSRQHCVLAHGPDGRVYLADLKSTHGTFLNGARLPPLSRVPLGDGDSFTVGGSSRTYRVVAAAGGGGGDGERAGRPGAPAAGSSGVGGLGDAPAPAPPPVDEAEARATARKQCEAEIAAMVASLAAPAPAPVGRPAHVGDDDGDDDGGPPLPMRRRVDDDEDADGRGFGAARSAGAGSAASLSSSSSSAARKGGIAFAAPKAAGGAAAGIAARAARVGGHADEVVGAPAASAGPDGSTGGGAGSGEEVPFPADDDAGDEADVAGGNDADDSGLMAAMALPTGFGSRKATAAFNAARKVAAARGDGSDGPASAAAAAAAADNPAFRRRRLSDADGHGDSDCDGDGDDDDRAPPQETVADAAKRLGLPVSHEVVLGGGGGSSGSSGASSKAVTALALDPSGSRLAVGTADYLLRLYDFGSMDRGHKPVRELTPVEGHPVHAVAFAPNGERFIVASGHAKARVFDARDGAPLATTVKGDPYITDMANTKGHTAGLTAAAWHPTDRDVVMTGSLDGSVRFWNLAHGKAIYGELCCGDVVKLRSAHRQRVGVSAAALAPDARFIAAAGDDGSLQLFNVRSVGHKYVRADAAVGAAHAPGGTTCVAVSPDGTRLATRSGADSTVKIWDVRKLGSGSSSSSSSSSAAAGGTPVGVITGVDTAAPTANVAWSPDGRLLVLGTAVRRKAAAAAAAAGGGGSDAGRLLAFSVADVEAAGAGARGGLDAASGHSYAAALVRGASVVAVSWHPRINQLAAGCGDGATRVLYDPGMSTKGALLSTARAAKARDVLGDDATVSINPLGLDIVAPNAPALFRDERLPQKRRFLDIEKDQLADPRRRPGLPSGEPEFLNRGKKSFTQHYMQTFGTSDEWRTQDPTEALRAYAAKAAASDGAFGTRAYATTQPAPLLEAKTHEQVEEEEKEEVQRLLGASGT
jgi:WD repeat-containing protein 70